jgi:dipeptidyl aminopeptidase/acylaminoacyl peptidase
MWVRALAAIVLVAAGAAFGWSLGHRPGAPPQRWSTFTQLTDASGVETGPTISPDGTSFAFASAARGSWDIYVQRVGGRNPVLVAGDPSRHEVWPAFSPDGKQIAFNQSGGRGGIFVVGATGESVRARDGFRIEPGVVTRWSAYRLQHGRSRERVLPHRGERVVDRRVERRTAREAR